MTQSVNSGFDIDEKLNDIIFKHHLDDVYPDYKKMLKAEKLAEELVKSWIVKNKLPILSTPKAINGQNVEFVAMEGEFLLLRGRKLRVFTIEEILDLQYVGLGGDSGDVYFIWLW